MSVTPPLTISYIELGVTDLPATRAFYQSAFGWRFRDYGPMYSAFLAADGESEAGGLNAGAAPGEVGPLLLLAATDLEAALEAVREAGGRIAADPYSFPGGRRFEFLDPSGNRLGVFAEEA